MASVWLHTQYGWRTERGAAVYTSTATAPAAPAVQAAAQADAGEPAAAPGMDSSNVSGAGAPAAAAPAGSGGAQAGAAGNAVCSALSTCCAALSDEDDREDCQEVVERNDAERCTRASERACQSQDIPTTPSDACSKLSTCCATLPRPPQQRDCQEEAMRANDERCTRQLQRICPELGPPPRAPACVTLQACCPMLTDPRSLELCRRALQEDEQRDCAEASTQLCQ